MATVPKDGSADSPRPSDVAPLEPDASADASAINQPDTRAVPDASDASQPDTSRTADAREVGQADASAPLDIRPASTPDSSTFADIGPFGPPDTSTPVDMGPGTVWQVEAGGEAGGTTVNGDVGSYGAAVLSITPASVNFGTVELGKSVSGAVVVANVGTVRSGSLVVNPGVGLTVTGCSSVLLPETSCTLIFTATPTTLGAFASSLSVTANPGPSSPLLVSVTGTAVHSGQFSVAPTAIDLGTIPVGVLAPQQTITLTTQSALTDLTVQPNGPDVKVDPTSTCASTLEAGVTCTVVVNFSASTAGSKSDSIVISAGGKTVAVPITATVVNLAKLLVSPSTATFATMVGVTSSPVTFGIANSGDVATGALAASIAGANAADFTISANSCLMLASLSVCSISVVFAPKVASAATETATLNVQDSGVGASAIKATLSGTAYSSTTLAITSTQSDLGTVPVGSTGAATVFTVTNSGDTASGTLAVSVSSPEFAIMGDTCSGASLGKSASCTVSLALKPTIAGAKSAILQVTGASTSSSAAAQITGTGIN
jgi:hypothetical protein